MVNPRDLAGEHRRLRRRIKTTVTYAKISPKMVNPRDLAGECRRRRILQDHFLLSFFSLLIYSFVDLEVGKIWLWIWRVRHHKSKKSQHQWYSVMIYYVPASCFLKQSRTLALTETKKFIYYVFYEWSSVSVCIIYYACMFRYFLTRLITLC